MIVTVCSVLSLRHICSIVSHAVAQACVILLFQNIGQIL